VNEFDDLDQLERECGAALRVALRRVAEEISVDTSVWQPGSSFPFLNGEHAALDGREAHTASEDDLPREGLPRRRWMLVAAAAIVVFAIGLLALVSDQDPDSVQTDTVAPTPAASTNPATTTALLPVDSSAATTPATVTPAPEAVGESAFAMTSPSAQEEAQAINDDLYRDGDVGTQVSAAGNSVSLRTCRDSAFAMCGTDWAYVTEVAGGGEVHGGLLGEASAVNLHLQPLDDRYFVASESAPDVQAPARAWLIDAISGQAATLSWRDEPTTLNSPEQRLLLCGESYSSFATHCAVVRGPDAADGGWQFAPSDAGLAKVVDIRDGTIRPLAVPDSSVAGLPVAQHGTGRIWIGIDPDDDRIGLAYSDDGGAIWNEVTLPAQLSATSEELTTSLLPYGDDLLEVAADGDRVAVAKSWGGDNNTVYVSNNAGTTWTTAASEPTGNGVHLYVLADGRLVVMGSTDPYPSQVLAAIGSDWTELESVDIEFAAEPGSLTTQRFSINVAGVAMIPSYIVPCDGAYPCPGYTQEEADSSTLDTVDFSTDLTNWSTIHIHNP
jgi:hypothetical protein